MIPLSRDMGKGRHLQLVWLNFIHSFLFFSCDSNGRLQLAEPPYSFAHTLRAPKSRRPLGADALLKARMSPA